MTRPLGVEARMRRIEANCLDRRIKAETFLRMAAAMSTHDRNLTVMECLDKTALVLQFDLGKR